MTDIVQKPLEEITEITKLIPNSKKNKYTFVLDVNSFIEKITKKDFGAKILTIKLILPKSIIFDPLQNDHIIINPFIDSQNYILSWKIKCLIFPCQTSNIIIEISY